MNYDEKVKFLKSFSALDIKIDLLIEEKQRWYDRALKITPSLSDMPKNGGFYDKTSSAIEKVVMLEKQIDDTIDKLVDRREQIVNAINAMEDFSTRQVLYLKYISGMSFEKIGDTVGYCERQVARIHKKGIEKLEI